MPKTSLPNYLNFGNLFMFSINLIGLILLSKLISDYSGFSEGDSLLSLICLYFTFLFCRVLVLMSMLKPMEAQIDQLREYNEGWQDSFENLQSVLQLTNLDYKKMTLDFLELQATSRDLQTEKSVMQNSLEALQAEKEALQISESEKSALASAMQKQYNELQNIFSVLQAEKESLQNIFDLISKDAKALQTMNTELCDDAVALRIKVGELESSVLSLKRANSALKRHYKGSGGGTDGE